MQPLEGKDKISLKQVSDFLLPLGFYPSGTCNCGGVLNNKFRDSTYTIYVRIKSQMFYIKQHIKPILQLTPLHELDSKFSPEVQAQAAGQQVQNRRSIPAKYKALFNVR